ncbi:MAG TPA: sigma-54 dependent transcriptional regulator [Burkholderiaceae bacterium]|nr:sigma-54 dependent transcriptional regulator [Burkholderiaceae bacterium]
MRCALFVTLDADGEAGRIELPGEWKFIPAAGLATASRLLAERPFDVAIVHARSLEHKAFMELDDFLREHHAPVWIGLFGREALALPLCKDVVVNHLFDHHTLPVEQRLLAFTLGHALGRAQLKRRVPAQSMVTLNPPILGASRSMQALLERVRRIAKVDASVLISGESGSGKELVANAVHRHSARSDGPFVAVNCGAIQPSLIQSELFGHVRGAFTGADRDRRGLIESAEGGTLFLDEIGDLPLDLQINLLRFLQEGTIHRVGSVTSIHVNVRVVAATHVDLEGAVRQRTFREDLYYRLNVLPVHVPPLRERVEDIELLAQHFFQRFKPEGAVTLQGFSHRALAAMQRHPWPGNVRELINRVRRATALAEGRLISPADLGLDAASGEAVSEEPLGLTRDRAECEAIVASLEQSGRNVTDAARRLGVSRMTLYRLMDKHGITNPHVASASRATAGTSTRVSGVKLSRRRDTLE